MKNRYSKQWFNTFLETIEPDQTDKEIDFISQHIPNPPFHCMLDLCCGLGRHANELAGLGYQVAGFDSDPGVIERARRRSPAYVDYRTVDMRDLRTQPGTFDAIVCLWQSFGYFDDKTNKDVLRQISEKLSVNGRFLLDIYQPEFFKRHVGTRTFTRAGTLVTERKTFSNDRMSVVIDYNGIHPPDHFDWQLYSPEEITDLAGNFGLALVVGCSNFDENQPITPDNPRMQLLFEKRAAKELR